MRTCKIQDRIQCTYDPDLQALYSVLVLKVACLGDIINCLSIFVFYHPIKDIQIMSSWLLNSFAFINEKVLRKSKESTVALVGVGNILYANIRHAFRHSLGYQLKLQYPNSTLEFPLPNRWCNPNPQLAKQQKYMVLKQVGINVKKAGIAEREQIGQDEDKSRGTINAMQFLNTIHLGEIENIKRISEKFGAQTEVKYLIDREMLFADSLVNGEVSYMLRKYRNQHFQLPQSHQIDEDYRQAFEASMGSEVWNDNSDQFGLSREDILRRIKQNDGIYAMLYQELEKVSQGQVIVSQPELYCQNLRLNEVHYMHAPYPIFLRVKTKEDSFAYICIAVGVRINKKVKIFSPFFASQGERLWRLVQSHIAQVVLSDFSVRVHLGIYHFTTNQYHVPVYRCLGLEKDKRIKENFSRFLQHTYSMFSRGLQGVNVAATASLVHPIAKYSLANKALNIPQQFVVEMMALTSNRIKIYQYNPRSILGQQGLSEEQVNLYFPKLSLDIQLFDIISEYIQGAYQSFHVKEIEQRLFIQINSQTQHMAVGKGNLPRPPLRHQEDVLSTLKNLCFTWVGFHSHTFSVISIGTYNLLRPSMLKKDIPVKETQWQNIQVCQQLPDPKIMMETGKLIQATTQRDSDNYLIDNIRRQAEYAGYHIRKHKSNPELCEAYVALQKIAWGTFEKLQIYEQKVIKINQLRKDGKHEVSFEWMIPSQMQTSLNI